jgi:hypothetical protein
MPATSMNVEGGGAQRAFSSSTLRSGAQLVATNRTIKTKSTASTPAALIRIGFTAFPYGILLVYDLTLHRR